MVIYVGDGQNIKRRIIEEHCSGNVEGSTFRNSVATKLGYTIITTLRPPAKKSGKQSKKVRIDLPNPLIGEHTVTSYIRGGKWKYIICENYEIAHDFQWYVIIQLKPLLNKAVKEYNHNNTTLYQILFEQLLNSRLYQHNHLPNMQTGPGIYVFHHDLTPNLL